MAIRIIAEAGVRLRATGPGLGVEIRAIISKAMREAQAAQGGDLGPSPTKRMAEDADRDTQKVKRSLSGLLNFTKGVASSLARTVASGMKLALIGTAAIGAVAGVSQLVVGIATLVQVAGQAAGVLGLLPAIIGSIIAVQLGLKIATSGVGDALKAVASGDAAAFDEALKNLSPSAREFARSIRDIKPAFDEMRLDVQEALFSEIADKVRPLADTYLPLFGAAFEGIARQTGIAGRQVADFLLRSEQVQKVSVFTSNLQQAWGNVTAAILPAASAILDVTTTGSTFLPGLTNSLSTWAQSFAARIREMAANGELDAFFQRAIEALRTLGNIGSNVFRGMGNIMAAAREAGNGLLGTLEGITQRFADFTGSDAGQSALVGFFETMKRVVDALGPSFFELITIVGRDLLPILADIAEVFGPVLHPLIQAFGRLLDAVRPLLVAVAEALGDVLAAFEPVIDAFSQAITDAMPTLGPMIRDIGTALANLVKSMAPLAPLFVELLQALLPIVPPLIQMVADIMPSLIELVKAIMPYIRAWAEAFAAFLPIVADVVNVLLAVLVPVISVVASILGFLLEVATAVFTGIWNVVKTVFTAIGEFIAWVWNGIADFFGGIFETIGSLFSDGIGGLPAKVGGWFSDIWSKITTAMGNILKAVGDALTGVAQWFLDLPGKILGMIGDAAKWLYDTGRDLIQGLINGIKDMIGNLISSITGAVDGAIGAARKGFGTHSPSTVFRDIGLDVGEGLVIGIDSMAAKVADSALRLATSAIPDIPDIALTSPASAPAAVGGGAAGAGVLVQQTNVMQPGTDVNQFANLVLRRGFGDYLSGANTLTVARNGVQAGVNDQWVTT